MSNDELIKALLGVSVETGNLVCLGCGHEQNCGIHGCAILREAAERLRLFEKSICRTPSPDTTVCYDAEFWGADDCTNTKCPHYSKRPCPAADGCGGFIPDNKPLTVEELREMNREPVWIAVIGRSDLGAWYILRKTRNNGVIACGDTTKCTYDCDGLLNFVGGAYYGVDDAHGYGASWLAYRRQPEKGGLTWRG